MENTKELSENKQCDIHVVMQKKFIKCFKLYKKVKADLDHYVNMRGSSFGVGVGTDAKTVTAFEAYCDMTTD